MFGWSGAPRSSSVGEQLAAQSHTSDGRSPPPLTPPSQGGGKYVPALRKVDRPLAGLALAIALLVGAGPPEVVRVQVPADQVPEFFPQGTELRGLSVKELNALTAAAQAGAARAARSVVPRLLRARHFARWEAGVLIGRSELDVEPAEVGPAELQLAPWTPAIDPAASPDVDVRIHDSGQTGLWIAPRQGTTIALNWQLRARSGSRARGFSLGLPSVPISLLELDLPAGWSPDGLAGVRQGPHPSALGRHTWRIEGPGGSADLRLLELSGEGLARQTTPIWVSGPTRIDLAESAPRPNWRADWTVDAEPRGPRRFAIELDPGLDLIELTGPSVDEYQAEVQGSRTRVAIKLKDNEPGPAQIVVRALAHAPFQGAWTIPAARPAGALWTGGTTTVSLDASRVVTECRERAGRRVLPRAGERSDSRQFVFEANAPEPVADLVFRKPGADASAEVRGQLLLGNTEPRLRSRLTWRVARGHLLSLDVELPPAWVPDEVRIEGSDEPVVWHPETRPDGAVRIHVVPSAAQLARASVVLNVSAVARIAGGRGPLQLPRVRPLGVRTVDEIWLAWADPTLTLRPTLARGLAWIDPKVVTSASAPDPTIPSELRETLAWRWIDAAGEARVDRERLGSVPSGSVQLEAMLDPHRIRLNGRITVNAAGEPVRSLAIGLTEPVAAPERWRFTDDVTGLELAARRIEPGSQAARGLSSSGPAWELTFPQPKRGTISVRAHFDGTWDDDDGRLPLLVLPDRIALRGTVLILADPRVRSTVQSDGLTTLDPSTLARAPSSMPERSSETRDAEGAAHYRRAHAFGYSTAKGSLVLRAETLEAARNEGVILEAALTTFVAPQGGIRHRLNLRVSADQAKSLDLILPPNAVLVRVRRDGQVITPSQPGRALSIAFSAQKALRAHGTITLDYMEAIRLDGSRSTLRPALPVLSWPCTSFSWTIAAPDSWTVSGGGPALAATDPVPQTTWSTRLFGRWYRPWRVSGTSATTDRESSALHDLDARVASIRPEEMTLGEWFTRWDANLQPIVVDRSTLAMAGLGPRTRVMPPLLSPGQPNASRAALRPLGLTVVSVGGSLLITTLGETPDRPGGPLERPETRTAWDHTLRQASAWGSDITDRFQSVGRWRGESTPKNVGSDEAWEREPLSGVWRTWRFVGSDWPGPNVSVDLIDERSQQAAAITLGLAIFGIGVISRNLSRRRRALSLALVVAIGVAVFARGVESTVPLAAGALLGAWASLLFWLGRRIPWPRPVAQRRRERRPGSTVQRRPGGSAVHACWIVGLVVAAGAAFGQAVDTTPILVLLPYEGTPDIERQPDRALMRLADYDRLQALAKSSAAPEVPSLTASSAIHRVVWRNEADAVVVTEFALRLQGGSSAVWRLPIENARDLSATVDGAPASIGVEPGGLMGNVFVTGVGPHTLRVRRRVSVRLDEQGMVCALPVNAVATARVRVEGEADDAAIDIPSARGRLDVEGANVEGWLGPTERLEVRRAVTNPANRAAVATVVTSLMLWDAEPAGDRVRARLTVRNPAGTSVLRLQTERGVSIRAGDIPGRVDIDWQGSEEKPQWVASIDPPLPDGTTVALDLWRPLSAQEGPGRDPLLREVPLLEPLEVRRSSGVLAFRRPADWSGRMTSGTGVEPITDEAFVKLWGPLPDDALTLAGTTRFVGASERSLRAGPVSTRLTVQPEATIRIGAGRVDLQLKGEVIEVAGRTDQVELQVPPDLRVIRVDAEGLADWSRPANDRIRIRFEGARVASRTVQLQGWVGVPSDPLAAESTVQEVGVPWPRWVGVESTSATLAVIGPSKPQFNVNAGLTLVSSESVDDVAAASALSRWTYRVERPENLGRMRWQVEPPKLRVLVESQLTVHPDSAEWIGLLSYTVSGGATKVIHLELPRQWAEHAQVHVVGDSHQLTSETRGDSTHWTIRPEHPIWGSERLLIRASLPLSPHAKLAFPNVLPLGRGTWDTYLALNNATGRALATEGSDVQQIELSTRFRDDLFGPPAGGSTSYYHVKKLGWSLRLQTSSDVRRQEEVARITLADASCAVAAGGAVLGLVRFEVGARSGPFLPLRIPPECAVLAVFQNAAPAPLLRSPSGRWLVPVDEEAASTVSLIWRAPGSRSGRELAVPAVDESGVPTLISVRASESMAVQSLAESLEPITLDRLALERASGLERRTIEALDQFDRGSLRDRENLVSALVAFELLLRGAERSVIWNLSGVPGARDERLNRVREGVKETRAALARKIEAAGLQEFLEQARVHAGLSPSEGEEPVAEVPEPIITARLRELGRPQGFSGTSSRLNPANPLAWSPAVASSTSARWETRVFWGATFVIPLLIIALARPVEASARLGALALGLALGALGAVGGPWVLAFGMGPAIAGRLARPAE